MRLDAMSCLSPTSARVDAPFAPARPEDLCYGFTLPAGPRSPGVARAVSRTILGAHGLAEVTEPVVQVVSELTTSAYRLSLTKEMYVSLRYRDSALRVTVHDGHPRHTPSRLGAICVLNRRVSLRLLDEVVRACRGEWGIGGDREPGGGTRMWAVLPRAGARAYQRAGT
ncbi:ATP-binding protein [Streptomyces phaeofaciens]|uniref:ATP-binding protein n=1 Tax=Streptomyces phaeofaciens TaxID=68254 RepID=UPI0036BC9DBF